MGQGKKQAKQDISTIIGSSCCLATLQRQICKEKKNRKREEDKVV